MDHHQTLASAPANANTIAILVHDEREIYVHPSERDPRSIIYKMTEVGRYFTMVCHIAYLINAHPYDPVTLHPHHQLMKPRFIDMLKQVIFRDYESFKQSMQQTNNQEITAMLYSENFCNWVLIGADRFIGTATRQTLISRDSYGVLRMYLDLIDTGKYTKFIEDLPYDKRQENLTCVCNISRVANDYDVFDYRNGEPRPPQVLPLTPEREKEPQQPPVSPLTPSIHPITPMPKQEKKVPTPKELFQPPRKKAKLLTPKQPKPLPLPPPSDVLPRTPTKSPIQKAMIDSFVDVIQVDKILNYIEIPVVKFKEHTVLTTHDHLEITVDTLNTIDAKKMMRNMFVSWHSLILTLMRTCLVHTITQEYNGVAEKKQAIKILKQVKLTLGNITDSSIISQLNNWVKYWNGDANYYPNQKPTNHYKFNNNVKHYNVTFAWKHKYVNKSLDEQIKLLNLNNYGINDIGTVMNTIIDKTIMPLVKLDTLFLIATNIIFIVDGTKFSFHNMREYTDYDRHFIPYYEDTAIKSIVRQRKHHKDTRMPTIFDITKVFEDYLNEKYSTIIKYKTKFDAAVFFEESDDPMLI